MAEQVEIVVNYMLEELSKYKFQNDNYTEKELYDIIFTLDKEILNSTFGYEHEVYIATGAPKKYLREIVEHMRVVLGPLSSLFRDEFEEEAKLSYEEVRKNNAERDLAIKKLSRYIGKNGGIKVKNHGVDYGDSDKVLGTPGTKITLKDIKTLVDRLLIYHDKRPIFTFGSNIIVKWKIDIDHCYI